MALVTTGLLERDRELQVLADALERGAEGEASAVLITGDAGLGKTSLINEAAELAGRLDYTVLRARGGTLERSLGWGVTRQLLEELVARAPAPARRSLLRGSASLAAPVLGLADSTQAEPSPLRDFHLEHGLYWLVCNLTERGPVAMFVDDAQWCDEATLEWLLYLVRRAERLPLTVILAMRSGEPDEPAALVNLIAAEPLTRPVALAPLTTAATEALVTRAYDRPIDEEFGQACHEWTGGNPLFVNELATELAAEGILPVGASAARVRTTTPESVARVVLLRIARLSGSALKLARALAVLESAAMLQHAAQLAGLDETAAAAALDELIAARVATLQPLGFAHPVLGAVVHDDIAPAQRAMLHKQAAHILAAAGAEPGRAAAHLLRSAATGDGWVVAELRRAAQQELARRSPSTAAALLRRARVEPPSAEAMPEVLLELGRAELLAGDPAGVETLRATLSTQADVCQRAETALLLGRLVLLGGDLDEAVAVARDAAEALGWEDVNLRLQLEALVIGAARADRKLVGLIPERLALARDHAKGDTYGSRLVAAQMAWGLTAIGAPVESCKRWSRRALSDGQLIRDNPNAPDTYLGAIHMLVYCDEFEEADSYYAQTLALAQDHGSVGTFSGASCFRAYAYYLGGRLEEAELLARDALRTSLEARGLALVQGVSTAVLALALIDRGAVDEALALLPDDPMALEESRVTWATEMLFAAGRGLVASGEVQAGSEALLATGRRTLAWGAITPAWLPWRSEAALALHQLGRHSEARRLSAEALELAEQFGASRPIGVVLRAIGLIEGGADGIERLRESCAHLAGSPAKLEEARSLVALGQALRRSNSRAQSREPLIQGLALAEQCGALPLVAQARTELAAAGARTRLTLRTGADALTPSERRVCELAAAGKTNPEIAQLLFVTRATVESHLHSAYARLGITSRKELAAALAHAS